VTECQSGASRNRDGGIDCMWQEASFVGNKNILYLDDNGYMANEFIHQKSSSHPFKMGTLHYVYIILQYN
jgi:hypothetical protein